MNLPPFDRRLLGITVALAILHFVIAVVAGAASRVFQTTFTDWACVVLTQPANALVQLLPRLSPTVQWVAFGANSVLWGFCLALAGRKWVSKRAVVGAAVFLFALALTVAGVLTTNTGAEWLGLAVAPIWAATLITSANVFPDLVGDVATPMIFGVGIVLNAGFLSAMVFIAIRIARRPFQIPVTERMTFACPTCKQPVYGWKRVLRISAVTPARCPACGGLAGPSWWNVVIIVPVLLLVMGGLYVTLLWRTWVPFVGAVAAVCLIGFLQFRYIPLVVITAREVFLHRAMLVLLLVGVVGWVTYQLS